MTVYCCRRGTATTMNRVLSSEMTRNLLHHKAMSDVLDKHYAINTKQVDLTAVVLYDEAGAPLHRMCEYEAPALLRYVVRAEFA